MFILGGSNIRIKFHVGQMVDLPKVFFFNRRGQCMTPGEQGLTCFCRQVLFYLLVINYNIYVKGFQV